MNESITKKNDFQIEEEYEILKKEYETLLNSYKLLEKRANLYKEDAHLARSVVTEYAEALSVSKSKYNTIVVGIQEILESELVLNTTKILRIKKVLKNNTKEDLR